MENRLETVQFGRNPTRNMALLIATLTPSGIVPRPNKYYTFIYKAKTRNIQYDQNPLIVSGDIFDWGFTGFNIHWEAIRRYSWHEVLSNIYELSEEEFGYLKEVPLAKIRNT